MQVTTVGYSRSYAAERKQPIVQVDLSSAERRLEFIMSRPPQVILDLGRHLTP